MPQKFLLLFFILIHQLIYAQDGAWKPEGAKISYPRTMLKASEIKRVQNSLSEASIKILYKGVLSSAFSSTPAGNSNSSERRGRATIAKNAGFTLLMDSKFDKEDIVLLTTDEKDILKYKVIKLLEEVNTDVPNFSSFTEWQWRSKELIDYLIAYDMLKGVGVEDFLLKNAKNKLQQFTGNLYNESTQGFLSYTFFKKIKNNHALMTAAALGMAAVVLNDASSSNTSQQPQKWIDAAIWNIDNVLWEDDKRQSERGEIAGFAEGPYYFKYAFINCLPFFRAMGNFLDDGYLTYTYSSTPRKIRNPFYDPDYDNFYEWMRLIRMPDGRMPALDDSFIDMAMPELALTGKSKYNWPLNFENISLNQKNSLEKQLNTIVDLRANYIAANTPQEYFPDETFFASNISGNIVFRSSSDHNATYMHIHAENGRALRETDGHNQADETSFIIHSHGQLLALDPGYLSYSRRKELGNAQNHNMVLINGTGPQIGTPGIPGGAEVFLEDAYEFKNLASAHVKTAYSGADVSRHVLFIRKKYFLISDVLSSSSVADYQWQLHGYGLEKGDSLSGIYVENKTEQKAIYRKNGVKLLAQVTAEGGISSFGKKLANHELEYNTTEDHTMMFINKKATKETSFQSLLVPFITEAPVSKIIDAPFVAAIKVEDSDHNDFVFSRVGSNSIFFSEEQTGLKKSIKSDAKSLFISEEKNGSLAQYSFHEGTELKYGERAIVNSKDRINFYLDVSDEKILKGKISHASDLEIGIEFQVVAVKGEKILNWDYNSQNKMLKLSCSALTNFEIEISKKPVSVALEKYNVILEGHKRVHLSWQTISEVNNDKFEIERSLNEVEWEKIGEVKGNGSSKSKNGYNFKDKLFLEGSYIVYYRLKQVDFNGDASFLGTKNVNVTEERSKSFKIYPNPAQGFVNIYFDDGNITSGTLLIFNSKGRLIRTVEIDEKALLQLDISELTDSIYFCRFVHKNFLPSTTKLVIVGN